MNTPVPTPHEVSALKARLRTLEVEASGLVRALRDGPEPDLPGPHLVLESAGNAVLISAAVVQELVRLVALTPVAGASPAVVGAFTYRGHTCFAVDLGTLLTGKPPVVAPIESHLVVLGTALPMALLVDRVESVVTGLRLVADAPGGTPVQSDALSPVVARVDGRVLPLLDAAQLAAWLEARVP